MRILPILSIAAIAAFAMIPTSPAHASGVIACKAGPQAGWKKRSDLEAKLKAEGWRVRKSKVDGGCYEVYGSTPDGVRVEAYFHPVTFEKLYVSKRGKILFRKEGY